MESLRQVGERSEVGKGASHTARLTLYDQYSAMAYGVITQIVAQPDIAQRVLIDLFASDQMNSLPEWPGSTACAVVRLARQKALEAKLMEPLIAIGSESEFNYDLTDNLPKFIFNLLFTKGFKPDTVAERLKMTQGDVMKAMREHVRSMRTR